MAFVTLERADFQNLHLPVVFAFFNLGVQPNLKGNSGPFDRFLRLQRALNSALKVSDTTHTTSTAALNLYTYKYILCVVKGK